MKKTFYTLLLAFLLVGLIFTSGCVDMSNFNWNFLPGSGGGSDASKTGTDFYLISGPGLVKGGETIKEGEQFWIQANIENYDTGKNGGKQGFLCIDDDVPAGISIGQQCKSFYVSPAKLIEEGGNTRIEKSEVKPAIIFGPLNYEGVYLDPYRINIKSEMTYNQISQANAMITASDNYQQITVTQDPAEISVTRVEKTITPQYIKIAITLTKTGTAKIFSPDGNYENEIFFDATLAGAQNFNCDYERQTDSGLMEFNNKKLINCEGLISNIKDKSYPLIMTLQYRIKKERIIPLIVHKK